MVKNTHGHRCWWENCLESPRGSLTNMAES